MPIAIRLLTDEDYDAVSALWNAAEQSRRALNPVDDTREGIARYLRRNPTTCFAAVRDDTLVGVILTGHDGRRGLIHHLCVHPDCRRAGVAARLVAAAEEALRQEGIQKILHEGQRLSLGAHSTAFRGRSPLPAPLMRGARAPPPLLCAAPETSCEVPASNSAQLQ